MNQKKPGLERDPREKYPESMRPQSLKSERAEKERYQEGTSKYNRTGKGKRTYRGGY